jgi:hypothetical protein
LTLTPPAGDRSAVSSARPVAVTTHTGEPIQPVRLYFRVRNKVAVETVFRGLACVLRDGERPGTWLWMYEDEATSADLQKRINEISSDFRPVVLSEMSFPQPRSMVMRFRSPDRAVAAARFFAHRFGEAAVLERVRILNRLVRVDEASRGLIALDGLLDRHVTRIDPEVYARQMQEALASARTREEKLPAIERQQLERRGLDVPEVEDFPVAVEDEDERFTHLGNTLRLRGLRAVYHWSGRAATLAEIVQDLVTRNATGVSP